MKRRLQLAIPYLIASAPGLWADGQFSRFIDSQRAGTPFSAAFTAFDARRADLHAESAVILKALNNDSDPLTALTTLNLVTVVLGLHPADVEAKAAARTFLPAVVPHYEDPDPPGLRGGLIDDPGGPWKQAILYFVLNSRASPPAVLIEKWGPN